MENVLEKNKESSFDVTSLERDDLVQVIQNSERGDLLSREIITKFTELITDPEMRYMANRVNDAVMETFWIALEDVSGPIIQEKIKLMEDFVAKERSV